MKWTRLAFALAFVAGLAAFRLQAGPGGAASDAVPSDLSPTATLAETQQPQPHEAQEAPIHADRGIDGTRPSAEATGAPVRDLGTTGAAGTTADRQADHPGSPAARGLNGSAQAPDGSDEDASAGDARNGSEPNGSAGGIPAGTDAGDDADDADDRDDGNDADDGDDAGDDGDDDDGRPRDDGDDGDDDDDGRSWEDDDDDDDDDWWDRRRRRRNRYPGPIPTPAEWAPPEGPVRIGLQAGHWRADEAPRELTGLRGGGTRWGSMHEWEVNLEIVRRTAAMLEEMGYVVDILPAVVPPSYRAHLFISIHADGSNDPNATGYRIAAPRRDATGRADEAVELMERVYGETTGLPRIPTVTRRMRSYYAFNFRRYEHALHPMTIGVIIETGFLTSGRDRGVIVDDPDRAARGIVDAVRAFEYTPPPNVVDDP